MNRVFYVASIVIFFSSALIVATSSKDGPPYLGPAIDTGPVVQSCSDENDDDDCGENEQYTLCSNGGCGKWNCSQIGEPDICIDPIECIPGCICQKGYYRSKKNVCVSKDDCDICGRDPNAEPGYGVNCGRLCSNYMKPPPPCAPVKNDNACNCKPGYVLDTTTNKCVKPINCPIVCSSNEMLSNCSNGGCSISYCSQLGGPIPFCPKFDLTKCKSGCVCKKGFLKSTNGTCVLKSQCDTCGADPNAIPGDGQNCGRLCSNYNKHPVYCTDLYNENGCNCKPGYVYDEIAKKCVFPYQCSGCNGDPNAQKGPGTNCGKLCSNYNKKPVACPRIYKVNGCDCKPGFAFDPNLKKCVNPQQCTSTCDKNEIFSNCTNSGCKATKCTERKKSFSCGSNIKCKKGCICQDGYYRDSKGKCVLEMNCDDSCGGDRNAEPGPGSNCGKLCRDLYNAPTPCPLYYKLDGCDCKPGFYFEKTQNKCVSPEKCTSVCGANETYTDCVNSGCKATSCSDCKQQFICDSEVTCVKGCECQDGYFKDSTGNCVLEEDCDDTPTCETNEIYSKCKNAECATDCADRNKPIACPAVATCTTGCICEEGYFRDSNGKCVSEENCDDEPVCGTNEIYSKCKNAECRATDCADRNKPIACASVATCTTGCICQEGYFRNSTGQCVLEKNCEPKCNGQNEYYDYCKPSCPPQTCESINKTYHCPLQPAVCKGGCSCKLGFYRNAIGNCISKADCLKCTGPNEFFSCGGACDNVCKTLDKQNKTSCPIVNIVCNKMCYCKDGFARDDNNICAPIEKCPKNTCKGPNEVFNNCPHICTKKTCLDYLQNKTCSTFIDTQIKIACQPQCLCQENYYRNASGICVESQSCETQACENGEVFSKCPSPKCDSEYCPLSSEDPQSCPTSTVCDTPRCICGFNRHRDRTSGKCISSSSCPPFPCDKPNQEYNSCPPVCPGEKCSDFINNTTCSRFRIGIVVPCKPQCKCSKGFYRDENNNCIPSKQCLPTCYGENEYYEPCISGCSNQTCDSINKTYSCPLLPAVCRGGCRCNPGFYRNKLGECISEENCLKCSGPKEYYTCGGVCDNVCATIKTQNQTDCPFVNVKCNEQCYCEEGYARDDNNICIPIEKCPVNKCKGPHEVYSECSSECSVDTCLDYLQNKTCSETDSESYPEPKCVCEENYYRNADGICVESCECESQACDNESVFSKCPRPRCDADYCPLSSKDPQDCITAAVCDTPRCVCRPNRHIDRSTDKCTLTANCPAFPCDDPNEVYKSCPAICPGEKCSDFLNNNTCSKFHIGIVLQCYPQCKCRDGFYRDNKGRCVTSSQCLPPTEPTVTISPNEDDNETLEYFTQGNTEFTIQFLYERYKVDTSSSMIASPFSVLLLLAQLALATTGKSLKELEHAMNIDQNEIYDIFPDLINELQSQNDVTLSLASKVYSKKNFEISKDFEQDSTTLFLAEAENLDFNNPTEAADTINTWVEQKTNDKITDLVSPDMFNGLTRLVLANAIYFKGLWQSKFNKASTVSKDFYTSNTNTIQVNMMSQKSKFPYAENENGKLLIMPYMGGKFSFVAILPNEVEGLSKLVETLLDATVLDNFIESAVNQTVQVNIPTMKINTATDLSDILKKLNIKQIFNQTDSGLTGISKSNEDLYVSDAVQKAFIEINEEGSEAAAANAVVISNRALARPPVQEYIFNADHPFLYLIRYKTIIVFAGLVV